MPEGERRLSAIMFTDMVGYAALTQKDESLTLQALERHRALVRPHFSSHGGREVKTLGDAFLVEFPSALNAVLCAIAVQQTMHDRKVATGDTISIRIGIHMGDVVEKGNDILGDAVNVASRIEPLAEPGGICITDEVYMQVRNKSDLPFVSLGERSLKNVSVPVGVYKVVMPWQQQPAREEIALPRNRIAILPFANMSPDPNDEYFADGMTEELIDRLAQVKQLKVIARTSVMSYKKKDKKAGEIAKELLVGSLVEGSVRKAGNRVRVGVQLIAGGTEEHLWSSHYDGSLDDMFAVQSEIAEKVAGELKVQLLPTEKNTLEKKPTKNMEAYNDFLRGRELFREGSEAAVRQALKLYERAVELDPSFARAHVGVAECHQDLAMVGHEPAEVMFPSVRSSLRRALDLDPNLAEAHASLGLLHFNEDDVIGAEAEAKRALELNPSLPEPYRMLSEVAAMKGDPEEMVRMIETAYHLDPILPTYIYLLGNAYFYAGKEQEVLGFCKKTEHLTPLSTYRNMTEYHLSKLDIQKAREFHAKYEKLNPTAPWATYMGGFIDALSGKREKALHAITKIEERKMGPIAYNHIAFVYYALGDMGKYFEYLNRALDEHTLFSGEVMYSPLLVKARDDSRYKELVEKLRRMNGLEK